MLFSRELVDGAEVVKGTPVTEVDDCGGSGVVVIIVVVAMAGVGVEAAEPAAGGGAVVAAASVGAVVVLEVVVVVAVEVVVKVVSGHGVCSPVRTGVPLKKEKASAATVNPEGEEQLMATVELAVPA